MANKCGAKLLAGAAGGGMLRMRVMAQSLWGDGRQDE